MEYRRFGNTGLKVSRLGFGCMTFDSLDQTLELLEKARDYGCNFFDGAEGYGDPRGNCEKLFGEALQILQKRDPVKWRRSDLVITTKLYFGSSQEKAGTPVFSYFGENELGSSFKHIQEGMDAALKRTKLKYFDIVYSHRFDDVTPVLEQVRAYTKLIRDGKAFYWGTSTWPVHRIIEAYWIAKVYNLIPPIVEQCQYSMFEREHVENHYLPIFDKRYQYATTIWGALDSGILTGKYLGGYPKDARLSDSRFASFYEKIPQSKHDKTRKLKDLAENKLGTSITKLALAWCLKNENTTVIILGARNGKQLDATFECYEVLKKLDDNIMKEIEEILKNKPAPDPRLYNSFGRMKKNVRERNNIWGISKL